MVGREDEPLNANKCHSLESESLIYDNTQNPSEIDSLINYKCHKLCHFSSFCQKLSSSNLKEGSDIFTLSAQGGLKY